jgi:hypothetical protein
MITLQVPTIVNKEEQIQNEVAYNIDDFPYSKFVKSELVKVKKISMYNISCAFDIETTTLDGLKNNKNEYITTPYGFMYQWQFCIKDTVCFGRTFEEFLIFLDRLHQGMKLNSDKKLCIYVHNLSYEFQFIKDFLNIISMFAKDKRKVMKFETDYFVFRCSYFLSNMSLSKFCENSQLCTHYKMTDTYNYKKVRTPKTVLTNEELAYCYNDVRGLCECIDTMLQDDTIATLPLTNTGFVRREFRKNMRTKNNRRIFEKTALIETEYLMLRRAFRGGNTHANRFYANKKLIDVYSYDIQSSYPTVMMTDNFPVGKFTRVTLDTQKKLDEYCDKYCVVMDIEFFNIEIKDGVTIPYIDIAHCTKRSKIINDNGRVLKADYLEMTLTNIDLEIIRNTYNIKDGLRVLNAMYSFRGKLPDEFRKTLMEFYTAKTELKGIEEKEYEYMKAKNRVNSSYGMMVTAIDHSDVYYENHGWNEVVPDVGQALQDFFNNRNNFLSYQWGVFVTANARLHLQKLIDKVAKDIVYIDTDSIKFLNKSNCELFENENKRLTEIALQNDIKSYATDIEGNNRYLGIWDFDGYYKEFKTLGAKKYCYVAFNKKKQRDEFHVTVSGMSKKLGAIAVGSIDNFQIGKSFHDIGRTTSWYNESDINTITVNGDTFTTASNIGILETTYKLGVTDEYFEILENSVDFYNE